MRRRPGHPTARLTPFAASAIFAVIATVSAPAFADDDLRAKAQNPVASMISLPLKLSADFGAPNGSAYILNVNPVIPASAGEWNLISRALIPVLASVEGPISTPQIPAGSPSEDRKTGLGDINYSLYASPAAGQPIWGVGPSLTFPTASDDALGSGKWSAGAAGVVLVQPGWGTYGGLARHLWSFAGDDDRANVNQSLFEPFVNYNLEQGWYLVTDMIWTYNWEVPSDQAWTIPVGGGAGRLFTIGKQPINARLEAYYNVVHPDAGFDWQALFTCVFLFPK